MGGFISRNPILWFFLACFLASIFLLGWLLLPFLSILILGMVVSGVFYPLFRFINNHPRIRSSFASLVTCIIIFFVLFVPIVFFVGSLTQQAYGLYQMARGAVINDQIGMLLRDTHILERANSLLSKFNY